MKRKYPDNIVWDEEQGFNSKILPYGSNVSAPAIIPLNNSEWKRVGIKLVNEELSERFSKLEMEYRKLIEEAKWNEIIYNSQFEWEPIIGHTYHLYEKDNKQFLSLIEPEHWNSDKVKFIGSTKLSSERKWIKL